MGRYHLTKEFFDSRKLAHDAASGEPDLGVTLDDVRRFRVLPYDHEIYQDDEPGTGERMTITSALPCTWTRDEEDNWNTSCKQTVVIDEGTPADNDMRFCAYCGKPLVQQELVHEEFDAEDDEL